MLCDCQKNLSILYIELTLSVLSERQITVELAISTGSQQYSSSDYYVWNARSGGSQLLFIFPTRVNLTTITLHYYSDNGRGLPRLIFLAAPDDFEVWNALYPGYNHVDIAAVPPGGEPAGLWNVGVNLDFMNVKKILMYKYSSSFVFALSEVEFFTCNVNRKYTIITFANIYY